MELGVFRYLRGRDSPSSNSFLSRGLGDVSRAADPSPARSDVSDPLLVNSVNSPKARL